MQGLLDDTEPVEWYERRPYMHLVSVLPGVPQVDARAKRVGPTRPNTLWRSCAALVKWMSDLERVPWPAECYICGGEMDLLDGQLDHVHPRSRGGSDDPDNLRWVHKRCNYVKGPLTISELRELAGRIASR